MAKLAKKGLRPFGPDRNRLVLLAGAGASFGVSKDHFPTTIGFLNALENSGLGDDALFNGVKSICQTDLGGDVAIDVEHILWRLQELIDHVEPVVRTTSTVHQALNRGLFTPIVGNAAPQQYMSVAPSIHHALIVLRDRINASLYLHYSHESPRNALELTWIPLLERLSDWPVHASIFTTNYDSVVEDAVELVEEREIGNRSRFDFAFSGKTRPKLQQSTWHEDIWDANTKRILVTKLHGSLDWEFINGEIHKSTATFKEDHKRHPIIYPGYKGYPQNDPFRSFHKYFERCLSECGILVVIGFAFRDEAINQAISAATNLRRLIVVDPATRINPPSGIASHRVRHIKAGFESCKEQLLAELDGLVNSDSPF